jgi:hypothetical protein
LFGPFLGPFSERWPTDAPLVSADVIRPWPSGRARIVAKPARARARSTPHRRENHGQLDSDEGRMLARHHTGRRDYLGEAARTAVRDKPYVGCRSWFEAFTGRHE